MTAELITNFTHNLHQKRISESFMKFSDPHTAVGFPAEAFPWRRVEGQKQWHRITSKCNMRNLKKQEVSVSKTDLNTKLSCRTMLTSNMAARVRVVRVCVCVCLCV